MNYAGIGRGELIETCLRLETLARIRENDLVAVLLANRHGCVTVRVHAVDCLLEVAQLVAMLTSGFLEMSAVSVVMYAPDGPRWELHHDDA